MRMVAVFCDLNLAKTDKYIYQCAEEDFVAAMNKALALITKQQAE